MNLLEIDETINDIQRALGFTVQSVSLHDKTLVLKLWQNHVSYYLVLSTRMGQQGAFLLEDLGRIKVKSQKKPLSLFASTHLKEATFLDVSRNEGVGRQVDLYFTNADNEDLKIQVCLVPSALNISIHKGHKRVSLNKPKDLPKIGLINMDQLKSRPLEDLKRPWLEEFKVIKHPLSHLDTSDSGQNPSADDFEKSSARNAKSKASGLALAIQKKRKAIAKVRMDLMDKSKTDFYDFATLMTVDLESAKIKYPELYDGKVNKHKLKDTYFEKHKALSAKRQRVEERLLILEKELSKLMTLNEEDWQTEITKKDKYKVESKTPLKTRKLEVASDLAAYYGKSAIDNMKLLRAAKSWHYWFHIKDIPSSHMILIRDKARDVLDEEIKKACQWFVNEVAGDKINFGEAVVEMIMAECRFVKPIKGDKLGRVNYSHEQIFRFRL